LNHHGGDDAPESVIEVMVAIPFHDMSGTNTPGNEPVGVSATLPLLNFLTDPEVVRFDAEVEAITVKVAWAFEEAAGATVKDVSKPGLARAVGLEDDPGFDLLSNRPGEGTRGIESEREGGDRRRRANRERMAEGVQPARALLAVCRLRLCHASSPVPAGSRPFW
jgi:hypothetical protein